MKYLLTLILVLTISFQIRSQTKFAVIGDYGKAGSNELNVSNLVKSWSPEFVITLGDNNYEYGAAETIDTNIGKYYSEFIYPYTGKYGTGDKVNRFFPSLGNHDYYTAGAAPYLSYFTLPGNERYYDFIKGNVHFFALDSNPNEPDGRDSSSVQAQWLKAGLAESSSRYNIVYFHHPPYSSSSVHGSEEIMQWPFREWGATIVLAGHDHTYERLSKENFTYIVNGLGGKSIYDFGTPLPESILRYNNNYGAMQVISYHDSIVFKFITVTPTVRDNFKLLPSEKNLELKMKIEGFADTISNTMTGDTVKVLLRKSTVPYEIIDSALSFVDSSGKGVFSFSNADNAYGYYLVLIHRNSLETWSASGNSFILNKLAYDFTPYSSRAYGNNLTLKGIEYCIYSGDQNQDGIIELEDVINVSNDANDFAAGYLSSDVTGDNEVNLSDILVTYNNNGKFVLKIIP
ncbi:MAG TPA: metallophosphoesterase [Ignavibacteria bacterium]|nr:metallophosphoesterase [Ignavibacteria bacterium]